MQTLLASLLILAGLANSDIAAPSFYSGNDELRGYILEASENNPVLKARHAEWQAALMRIPQVTALDDPIFAFTPFIQSNTYQYSAEIEQKFPWFGTLRARGDKATAEADAAMARFLAARNQVFADVKRAYFQLAYLGQSLDIMRAQEGVLRVVETTLRDSYAVGVGTQADLLRMELERERVADQRTGLEQSRPAVVAQLLAALGRSVSEDLPFPQSVAMPPAAPSVDDVLAQIKTSNPNVAAAESIVQSWEKQEVLAKKAGYPEFSLALGFTKMEDMDVNTRRMNQVLGADVTKMLIQDGLTTSTLTNVAYDVSKDIYLRDKGSVSDDVMVSFKVSVPIWRKKVHAGVQEAQSMQQAAEHERSSTLLSLESAARMTMYSVQDAQRRRTFYKDTVIPRQNEIYETLRSTYGTGVEGAEEMAPETATTEYVELQRTLRELLEAKLELAQAERDLQLANADLELLLGAPWTDPTAAPEAVTSR